MALEEITELVNDRIDDCREMMAGVFRIEEEFIEAIRSKRKGFMEKFMLGKVKEEGSRCIERIYAGKTIEVLTGRQAQQMCNELQPDGGRGEGKN